MGTGLQRRKSLGGGGHTGQHHHAQGQGLGHHGRIEEPILDPLGGDESDGRGRQERDEEIAEEIFDEVAFSMPYEVLRAHDTEKKENYICAKALIHSGHIEAGSIDGPYYKNPTVSGVPSVTDADFLAFKSYIKQEKIILIEFY